MLIIIIRDHTPIIIIRDLYNDHYHTRSRIMELGSWNSDHGILSYREHISNHTSPPVMPTIFATSVALHASINHHFPDLESQSFHVNQPDKHCTLVFWLALLGPELQPAPPAASQPPLACTRVSREVNRQPPVRRDRQSLLDPARKKWRRRL